MIAKAVKAQFPPITVYFLAQVWRRVLLAAKASAVASTSSSAAKGSLRDTLKMESSAGEITRPWTFSTASRGLLCLLLATISLSMAAGSLPRDFEAGGGGDCWLVSARRLSTSIWLVVQWSTVIRSTASVAQSVTLLHAIIAKQRYACCKRMSGASVLSARWCTAPIPECSTTCCI